MISARRTSSVGLLSVVVCACICFAATPTTPQPTVDALSAATADTRVLQSQVSQLQQKLTIANARNAQLQQENTALRRRLGLAPVFVPPVAAAPPAVRVVLPGGEDASALFIELPVVKWGSNAATDKQELIAHIPGASIALKPFNGTLVVKTISGSHVALLVSKTSKALGEDISTPAGNLFVQNGSLYLQWAAGDQSAALEALKYASLEVREQPDAEPKVYSMVHPVEGAVTLNQPAAKLPLAAEVAAKGKLALRKSSADWQSTNSADGSLVLKQDGLEVNIKLDATGGIAATCDDPDPDHIQRRMDALNVKYKKYQTHLAELEAKNRIPPARTEGHYAGSGTLYYPPTVEDRSALISQIHTDKEELTGMDKARPRLQAELDAVSAKNRAIADLDGSGLVLSLPNGVKVADVTLHVGETPTPQAKK